MITPDNTTASGAAPEICAPLGAVAVDGVPPAMGDTVEYQGRARVTRVEGDKVYLDTTEVNGMPTHRQGSEETEERDEMMRQAEENDAGMGY
jgi:hypothetical protein